MTMFGFTSRQMLQMVLVIQFTYILAVVLPTMAPDLFVSSLRDSPIHPYLLIGGVLAVILFISDYGEIHTHRAHPSDPYTAQETVMFMVFVCAWPGTLLLSFLGNSLHAKKTI